MKKILTLILSTIIGALSLVSLVGCGNQDEKTVMNVSCNPSVEFVLDKDDKVVSVNALNEEGNLILTAQTFVGKDAEEAAKLFVQVSKETGFIVAGSVKSGENEIEIAFSGDAKSATELYNSVKDCVDQYLSEENITATLKQAQAITEEQLEKLVAECEPYMKEAEIKALNQMELVEKLYESRKETVDLYSQELKNAYYEAKANILQQAEVEYLKSKVPALSQIALEISYTAYTAAVDAIENIRLTQLVNEDSAYQLALKAFREAKVNFLKYREQVAQMEQSEITPIIQATLDGYESAVNSAEQTLISVGQSANLMLDSAKEDVTDAYNKIIAKIEQASIKLNDHLDEIGEKQAQMKEQFFTDFETAYAQAITSAQTNWENMKTELENKTAE